MATRTRKRKRQNPSGTGDLRSALYLFAKLLGDLNAVGRGKGGTRIGRRALGKLAGRSQGKFFR